MLRPILPLAILLGLTGCSYEIPQFLGREGSGDASFSLAPSGWPDPVPAPLTSARIEPALRGIIVRVEGLAPAPGYHTAQLGSIAPTPAEDVEEDRATSGYIDLEFTAFPPADFAPPGPTEGRVLHAAMFLPLRFLEEATAIRIRSATGTTTLPLN